MSHRIASHRIASHRIASCNKAAAPLLAALLGVSVLACGDTRSTIFSERRVDPLRYEHRMRLAALGETATVVKTPNSSYAIRQDGRVQSVAEMRRQEFAARRAKYHLGDLALERALTAASPGDTLKVFLIHRAGFDFRNLRLQNGRALLRAALVESGHSVAARALSLGAASAVALSGFPAVATTARPDVIRRLATDPQLTAIILDADDAPVRQLAPLDPGQPMNMVAMDIISGFNNRGWLGDEQRIGILDANTLYGIADNHYALSSRIVLYESASTPCTDGSECVTSADRMCVPSRLGGTRCASIHASQVASATGARMPSGDLVGAARSLLYIANHDWPTRCRIDRTNDRYEWFASQRVPIVVEPWHCYGASTMDGVAQDWHARVEDVAIFKAAGNQEIEGPEERACEHSANSICVASYNTCVSGGTTSLDNCARNHVNPTGSDREEPDLTSFDSSHVILGGDDDWTALPGTSFTAPLMAGFAALLREACGEKGLTLTALDLRSFMMNAGWARNTGGWKYSTPGKGVDHRDGAGAPLPDAALVLCGYGSPSTEGIQVVTDKGAIDYEVGEEMPPGDAPPLDTPPPGGTSLKPGLHKTAAPAPGPGDGRLGRTIAHLALNAGQRVRLNVSWNSCPASDTGTAPAPLAGDLDLFLYDEDREIYVYTSQSVDDTNEGLDITVPQAGRYRVLLGYTRGAGCPGSTGAYESYSFAGVVFR